MKQPTQAGFTLIETLVATVLLTVGFLALAMLHVGSFRASGLARSHTLATILAYEQIERFHRLGSDDISTGADQTSSDGTSFSRSWTTTSNGGISKTVEVAIGWTDQWGDHEVKVPSVVRQ